MQKGIDLSEQAARRKNERINSNRQVFTQFCAKTCFFLMNFEVRAGSCKAP
jgi:hypothetical protein